MKAALSNTPQEARTADSITTDSSQNLREELHQQSKSEQKIVTQQSLMEQYLLGKLTEGELAFELKKLNDVAADTIIKEGKHSSVSPMQFKETARANLANPGADLNPHETQETSKPSTASEAKRAARNTDDKKLKHELEQKEQKLQQQQNTQRVTEILNFVQDGKQRKEQGERYRDAKQKGEKLEGELQKEAEEVLQNTQTLSSRVKAYLAKKLKQPPSIAKLLQKRRGGASGQSR